MKKVDKFSIDNDTYRFSFILRQKNPLERAILEKLNILMQNGYTQKDAIMTLLSINIINNDSTILDTLVSKSVQSKEKTVQNETIKEKAIKVPKEISIESSQQEDVEPALKERLNNDTYNTTTPEDQAALKSLLQGIYH